VDAWQRAGHADLRVRAAASGRRPVW
jgi:hypothetical protein